MPSSHGLKGRESLIIWSKVGNTGVVMIDFTKVLIGNFVRFGLNQGKYPSFDFCYAGAIPFELKMSASEEQHQCRVAFDLLKR